MAEFKKYLFEKLFGTQSGYVLDFSNMTFQNFFEEYAGVDIYSRKYSKYGDSKGKRLKGFFDVEDNYTVAKLLKSMLEYYTTTETPEIQERERELFEKCQTEIEKLLEGEKFYSDKLPVVDNKSDLTIKELHNSLETDLTARRFNAALDRLHTYCIKYFRQKAGELQLEIDKERPLHSIAGEVIKAINIHQSEMTIKILRSSLSILDNFNKVRNEQSLAHDNDILDNSEARLIVDWVLSFINFFETCFEKYKNNTQEQITDDDDIPF